MNEHEGQRIRMDGWTDGWMEDEWRTDARRMQNRCRTDLIGQIVRPRGVLDAVFVAFAFVCTIQRIAQGGNGNRTTRPHRSSTAAPHVAPQQEGHTHSVSTMDSKEQQAGTA